MDLPAGSFFSPTAESALEAKFGRELSPSIGAPAARAGFAAGLRLEELELSEFIIRSGLGAERTAISAVP